MAATLAKQSVRWQQVAGWGAGEQRQPASPDMGGRCGVLLAIAELFKEHVVTTVRACSTGKGPRPPRGP